MTTVMTDKRSSELDEAERVAIDAMIGSARTAMSEVPHYEQGRIDRLIQAIGWAVANEKTFTRLAHMSVEESKLGDREGRVSKRFKIMGVLRDALRQKSVGVIEELYLNGVPVREAVRAKVLEQKLKSPPPP